MNRYAPSTFLLSLLAAACGGPDAMETATDTAEIWWNSGSSIDAVNTSVGHLASIPGIGTTSYCTTVLVGPRTALTAKHCKSDFLNQVRFNTGGFRYGSGTTYAATNIVVHPTLDLAVIRFDADIPGITPSPVATNDFAGPYPLAVEISGYGVYGVYGGNGYTYGRLRDTTAAVSSFDGNFLRVAGSNGGTACEGDSGGPAFVGTNKVVWGIVNSGNPACNATAYSDYQRVTRDLALWIKQNSLGPVYFDGHTNPVQREDVNGDGTVSPLDALLVINHLNAGGGALGTPNTTGYFRDVNGDGAVSAIDVLIVINY